MAKNRISAVFLTALFLILCGLWPVSACLLQGGTPEDTGENRTLAAYPELKNLRDLERFPAGFEAWLNDHMPAKTALVGSQSALELGLFGEMAQDKVVFGTSRPWLFNRSEDGQPLETYKRTNLFSEEELDRISQNLSEMQQDFSDAGIRMVLMISPDKEQIYGDDYMPSSVAVLENEGRTEQLIGALGKTCPSLPVVYPAELLRKGREKEEVYYASTGTALAPASPAGPWWIHWQKIREVHGPGQKPSGNGTIFQRKKRRPAICRSWSGWEKNSTAQSMRHRRRGQQKCPMFRRT